MAACRTIAVAALLAALLSFGALLLLVLDHGIVVALRWMVDYEGGDLVDVLWNVSIVTTGNALLANFITLDCLIRKNVQINKTNI